MVDIDADGWPVGEKRFHCANCPRSVKKADGKSYPDGDKCKRKKRVGIGFCRDFALFASKGGN